MTEPAPAQPRIEGAAAPAAEGEAWPVSPDVQEEPFGYSDADDFALAGKSARKSGGGAAGGGTRGGKAKQSKGVGIYSAKHVRKSLAKSST